MARSTPYAPQNKRQTIGWAIIVGVVLLVLAVFVISPRPPDFLVANGHGTFECRTGTTTVHHYENVDVEFVGRGNNAEHWAVTPANGVSRKLTVNPRFTNCGLVR